MSSIIDSDKISRHSNSVSSTSTNESPGKATPAPALTTKTDNLYTTASSSSAGFFQSPPHVLNQYHDDPALKRGLKLFLPKHVNEIIKAELVNFGDRVLNRETLGFVLDAERNLPYVKSWDTWGKRRDELITSKGWQNLQNMGIEEGIVAIPYENTYAEYSRVYWCAKYAIWCGSSAWVNCPSLMVDGVASALRKHLTEANLGKERSILQDAFTRLTSRDSRKAWTTGQWMTERQGGSDVSMTETLATHLPEMTPAYDAHGNKLGPWRLDGFKWFSSATDANMMVLLARTSKGISLFFAPMRKKLHTADVLGYDTELNGVYIQRLKNKLGTKALPTAELELKGVRGWLIGEEGRGTKEIATVLNIARLHNGLTAIGLWGRGLGIVRAFVRVRVIGRRPLWERKGYMRTVARMHVEYRANVLLNFFVSALLGCVEQKQVADFEGKCEYSTNTKHLPGVKSASDAEWLLRVLTPALKGHCSKTAISGLQECMESMGGVGYLENDDMQFNIARLYRDANVLPIWEGTTDMMADDSVIRVMFGKNKKKVLEALTRWVEQVTQVNAVHTQTIQTWWEEFAAILDDASKEEVEMKGRIIMTRLVDIVQGSLLIADFSSDNDEVAQLVMQSWFSEKNAKLITDSAWRESARSDMKIVFGCTDLGQDRARL